MANPNYIVRVGETIRDVVINAAGSFDTNGTSNANWDAILTAMGATDWVPPLAPGQSIPIPSTVSIDANTLRNRTTYPANNGSQVNYLALITAIWNLLINNWILLTGYWNDQGIWIDTDVWID